MKEADSGPASPASMGHASVDQAPKAIKTALNRPAATRQRVRNVRPLHEASPTGVRRRDGANGEARIGERDGPAFDVCFVFLRDPREILEPLACGLAAP